MNEWNIQSRAHACQACAKHFSDQQPYHTLLSDVKHEIQRLDICEPCWRADHHEGARDRKGFISHWQGVYEVPPPAPPEAIQKENAETLLRKLIELNDPKYAAASYILAVMLERKRILKVKEQIQREGQRIFVYEQPKTGDVFTFPTRISSSISLRKWRRRFCQAWLEPARRTARGHANSARPRPRGSRSRRRRGEEAGDGRRRQVVGR